MQSMKIFAAIVLICFAVSSHALPLSTSSRWIVDDSTGERVKLVCANWPGHLEPMLPEGLDKHPMSEIARSISLMGFNCIRLTWAIYMYTRHANLTVAQNFQDLGLTQALAGIQKHNPEILSLTVVDAQKALVDALASHGIMVLLDNHLSKPMWCCNNDDGNGFFGDEFFDPQEWLHALSIVSHRYRDTPMVMAMSLRNELRGPNQTESAWYHYVEKGAKTIHRGNPNLLVLISGLDYDIDFRFLKKRPLKLNIGKKLVYETHRYSFTEGQSEMWVNQSVNHFCANVTQEIEEKSGFLFKGKHPSPLFITEFGIDQRGVNPSDNNFLACYLTWLAENDLDWSLWALQGSYYIRDNTPDFEETYGMFNTSWKPLRSPQFHTKLQLIQQRLRDPFSKAHNYLIMYHPMSGKCAEVVNTEVLAGDCWGVSKWSYEGEGTPIRLKGTNLCLTAIGDGLPVALTDNCMSEESTWKLALSSQYQLANKDEQGNDLCLHWDQDYSKKVLTKKCIVAEDDDDDATKLRNPQSQWFKLVTSNA